ncbi:30S ribosomal protein S8 [Candidatus Daviesbacteria bacterium]|nr:30S ribosomal protein S8 [Candidatus Daviesbacteria bacterium]
MDIVADALIRIKNGYQIGKQSVVVRYSKLIFNLMQLLKDEGFLEGVQCKDREIVVTLKYITRKPAISDIKRISKPSLRIYKRVADLPYVLSGLGIAIISTPRGLMTDKQARKNKIGGEVLAFVW